MGPQAGDEGASARGGDCVLGHRAAGAQALHAEPGQVAGTDHRKHAREAGQGGKRHRQAEHTEGYVDADGAGHARRTPQTAAAAGHDGAPADDGTIRPGGHQGHGVQDQKQQKGVA